MSFGLMSCLCLYGQDVRLQDRETSEYASSMQLWGRTQNPAGLSRDSIVNRGVSFVELFQTRGSFYRVQDGNKRNTLIFSSEQYQTIGKYFYGYGRFRFDMGRIFNRSWSDVMRSHNSNPYFSGSSVNGKYEFQNFDLSARISTLSLRSFTLGMGLDYKVGDLSRLKDPRSRSMLADYRLIIGLTWNTRASTWGASGYYHRRKEKIPNITTVQTDPNLKYYTFTGLENCEGTVGGYSAYEREFVKHEFGGEGSYQYKNRDFSTIVTLAIASGKEDVWGNIKYSPGQYRTVDRRLSSSTLLRRGNISHRVDLNAEISSGKADEYRQERIIEKNPTTGIESTYWRTLLTYNDRYTVDMVNVGAQYRIQCNERGADAVKRYLGVGAYFRAVDNKYTLPESSFSLKSLTGKIEGGYSLSLNTKSSLWFDASVSYHKSLTADMKLHDASTDFAVNVLLPDMEYYKSSYVEGGLGVQYQFPITIKNMTRIGYVKAFGSYLRTDRSTDERMIGFGFGLYH